MAGIGNKSKAEINLLTSINTDSIDQNIYEFGNGEAPHIENTGIERDGGITNLKEIETALPEGKNIITEGGQVLNYNNGVVSLDGKNIASISPYGVEQNTKFPGYEDIVLTADNKVLGLNISTTALKVTEMSYDGTVLRSRETTFSGLTTAYQFFSSISFVRYDGIKYDDVLEFLLRLGEAAIVVNEGTPDQPLEKSLISSDVLGTNNIYTIVNFGPYLVVAGAGGRVGSFDGQAWKNYNGSGVGSGPYNDGTAVGSVDILSSAIFNNQLVVGANSGRVASFDGTNWRAYNTAGTGLWNNGTAISTDNVTAMTVWDTNLIIGGSAGKLASFNGSTWTNYNAAGISDNATLIGAVAINSIHVYGDTLVIAGASGRVGSGRIVGGATWTFTTIGVNQGWQSIAYGNGRWVAVGDGQGGSYPIYYSDNGISWLPSTTYSGALFLTIAYGNGRWVSSAFSINNRTFYSDDNGVTWNVGPIQSTSFAGSIVSIAYGNGRWVAVANTTSTTAGIAYSSDGINWTFTTTTAPGGGWRSIAYDNGRWVAVAQTTSTTAGIAYSSDGINWTFTTTTAPGGGWQSIAYGNGRWVAVAQTTSTTAGIAYSNNGINWTFTTTTAPGGAGWSSVAYGNGRWVAVAQTTSTTAGIAYSNNGINWTFTTTTAPGTLNGWYSVAYGGGRWVAASLDGGATTSMAYSSENSFGKQIYTASSFNLWPSNNGTVIGSNGIYSLATFNGSLVVTGAGGRVGSFLNGAWTNYNASGASDDGTNMGSSDIRATHVYGGYLVTAGAAGRMASFSDVPQNIIEGNGSPVDIYEGNAAPDDIWTATAWFKYPYNGSSGIRSNGTAVGANTIYDLDTYDNKMVIGAATSLLGAMYSDFTFASFWTGPSNRANLLAGFTSFNYVYCFRYDTGNYLLNLVGNTNNLSFSFKADRTYIELRARYVWPQKYNNKIRHIITGDPVYDASKIESIGLQGYTDFTTYTDATVYPAAAYASITSVPSKNIGWAATDHTFAISSAIYSWTPEYKNISGSLYQVRQTNTDTLVNAYAKLTNNVGVVPSVPFEIRLNWAAGVMSYLSVARTGGPYDNLGTLITGVGEFDDTYTPQIQDDTTIIYRFNNSFYLVKIGTDIENRLQQVDGKLYKINTISPFNLVDTERLVMAIGSADYNGRMIYDNTTVTAVVATPVASLFKRHYSNSIDVGEKLLYITNPTSANIEIPGVGIQDSGSFIERFGVDTYINGLYSYTTYQDSSEFVDTLKIDLPYIGNNDYPIQIGVNYFARTANSLDVTYVLKNLYDGYTIGNSIDGTYKLFELFNRQYAFDGKNIYSVEVANNVLTGFTKLCAAYGLVYIASSPTSIFFYSSFDNSIYTFDGGQTISKAKRLNKFSSFIGGAFSVKDNTLLFETQDELLWTRDELWTKNIKKETQTDLRYVDSTSGLILFNNNYSWRYDYYQGEVMPLVWQSAYMGIDNDEKSILSEYVATIYTADKEDQTIFASVYTVDESDNQHEQQVRFDLDSSMYSSDGYFRIRIQPEITRPVAASIKLTFDKKIVVYDVIIKFADASTATVAASKTR